MGEQDNQMFMLISLVSWLGLVITGWMSLGVPNIEYGDDKVWIFWSYAIFNNDDYISDEPLVIHFVLFYMVALLTLVFITAAFLVICMSFVKKDGNVLSAMSGGLAQFHFVPILCVCALFIIGETTDEDDPAEDAHYIFSIIFGFIALASLIFFHFKTNLDTPSYAAWTIKHCAYGSLIAFLIHHIGYAITTYGLYDKDCDDISEYLHYDECKDWRKGCYIAFSIIIGICSIGVSLFLKEIVIPFINLLIYIGMTTQFYKLDDGIKDDYYDKAPGIINIIMMVFSLVMVCFLGMKLKQS
jgi:hypothetical protein